MLAVITKQTFAILDKRAPREKVEEAYLTPP
jgi:hypothetical protein